MHAFQDPAVLAMFGSAFQGHPFLSETGLTAGYLAWTGVWTALVLGLTALVFRRRDL
jgi:hypothetical protein